MGTPDGTPDNPYPYDQWESMAPVNAPTYFAAGMEKFVLEPGVGNTPIWQQTAGTAAMQEAISFFKAWAQKHFGL